MPRPEGPPVRGKGSFHPTMPIRNTMPRAAFPRWPLRGLPSFVMRCLSTIAGICLSLRTIIRIRRISRHTSVFAIPVIARDGPYPHTLHCISDQAPSQSMGLTIAEGFAQKRIALPLILPIRYVCYVFNLARWTFCVKYCDPVVCLASMRLSNPLTRVPRTALRPDLT